MRVYELVNKEGNAKSSFNDVGYALTSKIILYDDLKGFWDGFWRLRGQSAKEVRLLRGRMGIHDEGQFVVDLGEISEELFGLLEEKLVYEGIMDMRNFY